MDGQIKIIQDRNGANILPVTSTDAVITTDNKTLTVKLNEIGTGGGIVTGDFLTKDANGKLTVTKVGSTTYTNVSINNVTATASSTVEGSASQAFDGVLTGTAMQNYWASNNGLPQWLQAQFNSPKNITKYSITARNTYQDQSPSSWILQGSNNGTTWVDIHTVSNMTGWTSEMTREFTIENNTSSYTYYRLYVTVVQNGTLVALRELSLYEGTPSRLDNTIQGKIIPIPTASDDEKVLAYDNDTSSFKYVSAGGTQIVGKKGIAFYIGKILAVETNTLNFIAPVNLTIKDIKLSVDVSPVGADIIVDINTSGTTIFTTQANRPKIVNGSTSGTAGIPDITQVVMGEKISLDIDQVGSTTAGTNLSLTIICEETGNPYNSTAVQEGWNAITLQNNWVNYGTPTATAGYMKDLMGFVHIKGQIKNGTTTGGTILFNLPVGYRPSEEIEFPLVSYSTSAQFGTIKIYPNGEVRNYNATGNTWMMINNIIFKAEQ